MIYLFINIIVNINLMNDTVYDYVIYHQFCSDGIASAWAIQHNNNSNIIKIGIKSGDIESLDMDQFIGKTIIFVDISPTIEQYRYLKTIVKFVSIIDHHDSSFENFIRYKVDNSTIVHRDFTSTIYIKIGIGACVLTWSKFSNLPCPWFLQYIGDRDVWTFNLTDSKAINMALYEKKLINCESFTQLYSENSDDIIEELALYGSELLRDLKNKMDPYLQVAKCGTLIIQDNIYYVWTASCDQRLRSEIGNELCTRDIVITEDNIRIQKPDFAIIWQKDPSSDNYWLSLRGIDRVDLNKISKQLDKNGGGHFNSSGCTVKNFDQMIDYFN